MASILVVDDFPGNLALAKRRLSQGGHEVHICLDAETALELIESGTQFDLIILDVVLPGMSSFDLCQKLRQRDDTKEAPVLFMTGERHEIPDRLAGFASGANDYLLKPVDPRELLARVDVLLALRDALRESKCLNQELGLLVKERTRALEQALDRIGKQHALLESMVNQLPASVVVHDDSGRLVSASAVAERLFGIAAPGSKLRDGPLEPFFSKQNWPKESRENHWVHAVSAADGKRRRRFEAERTQLDSEEPRWLLHIVDVTARRMPLASQKKLTEREAILSTLRQLRGQKRLAAKELGIGKSSLYRKIKEYGISQQEIAGPSCVLSRFPFGRQPLPALLLRWPSCRHEPCRRSPGRRRR